jgi:hypothetical protein
MFQNPLHISLNVQPDNKVPLSFLFHFHRVHRFNLWWGLIAYKSEGRWAGWDRGGEKTCSSMWMYLNYHTLWYLRMIWDFLLIFFPTISKKTCEQHNLTFRLRLWQQNLFFLIDTVGTIGQKAITLRLWLWQQQN